jgi:hypothetical protein
MNSTEAKELGIIERAEFPDETPPTKAQADIDRDFARRLYSLEMESKQRRAEVERVERVERELRMLQFAVLMLAATVYLIQRELYATPEPEQVTK